MVKITSIDNGGFALVFGWVQHLLGLVEFGCENLLYDRSVILIPILPTDGCRVFCNGVFVKNLSYLGPFSLQFE